MVNLKRLLDYAGWPAATGLLAALVILLALPRFAAQGSGDQDPSGNFGLSGLGLAGVSDWSGPASYSAAVKRAAPAVVNIYTSRLSRSRNPLSGDPVIRELRSSAGRRQQQQMLTTLASAVIASEEGYILTNIHVISGAEEIIVQLHDGREARATAIGAHSDS